MVNSPNPTRLVYRFFDLTALLVSDSAQYVAPFAQMYQRFQVADRASQRPSMHITLCTSEENAWGCPVLIIDDQSWPLREPIGIQGLILEHIFHAIIARVRSHILIHAGVLARNGRSIMLVGDSQHGKTTLVLKLLQRGFHFLSDELAALGRQDGLLHPFPRSLRVRPGSLERAGYGWAADSAYRWLEKLLLDIETLEADRLGEKAAPTDIVLLQDPALAVEADLLGDVEHFQVTVARSDDMAAHAIRKIEGVRRVDVEAVDRQRAEGHPYAILHIQAENRSAVLNRVEAYCATQQILLLDIKKRIESQPRFEAPARLAPIRPSQMVIELLRRFEGTHQSAVLREEHHGSAAGLYLELADLIKNVRCHRLYVGPLEQMAGLVCELVEQPGRK
jgi:hypothetical protein